MNDGCVPFLLHELTYFRYEGPDNKHFKIYGSCKFSLHSTLCLKTKIQNAYVNKSYFCVEKTKIF